MKIVVNLLPTTVVKARDIIYSYEEEAARVANDILQPSPDGKTYANPYSINEPGITIQEVDPTIAGIPLNTQSDGRKYLMLTFTKDLLVDMSLLDPTVAAGRTMNKTLTFTVNAGQALQLLQNNPILKWEFATEGSGSELQGTLEKLN